MPLRGISSPVQPWDELSLTCSCMKSLNASQAVLKLPIPILLVNPSHEDWHITSKSGPNQCQCATMGTGDTLRVPSVVPRNHFIPFLPLSTLPGMAFSILALPQGQS